MLVETCGGIALERQVPGTCLSRAIPVRVDGLHFNFGDFCNLIVGETFYQTIRWDDYTTYAQSVGSYVVVALSLEAGLTLAV